MKKFYESPVVELTGFSAEDVITTSAGGVDPITVDEGNAADFVAALKTAGYENGAVIGSSESTSYNW